MPEIVCPNCHTAFQVDESGYAEILRQVRDKEFNKQIAERLALAEREKETALQLARAQLDQQRQQSVADKDAEIAKLQAQIASLSELSEAKLLNQLQRVAAEKDAEIQKLTAQVQAHDTSKALAIRESIESVQQERDALRAALDRAALEKELAEKALVEKYQTQIRDRDEAIERLRDMKARSPPRCLAKPWSSIAKSPLTRSAPPPFRMPTSRRTPMHAPAARAIISSAILTLQIPPTPSRSYRLCSR